MSKEAKSILSNVLYIAGVLFLSFLIVRYVGQRTEVIGNSMVPTLQDEDQLITDKITYRFRDPERFDIIVFPHEPVNEFYIKRIIGMPGETVERNLVKSTATGSRSRRKERVRSSWGKMNILSWETTGR